MLRFTDDGTNVCIVFLIYLFIYFVNQISFKKHGHLYVCTDFWLVVYFVAGLYIVGEKGEKGLPGPPGRCDCDRASNAPFGSYTQRGGPNKVPAVRKYYFTIYSGFWNYIDCLSVLHWSLLISFHYVLYVCV